MVLHERWATQFLRQPNLTDHLVKFNLCVQMQSIIETSQSGKGYGGEPALQNFFKESSKSSKKDTDQNGMNSLNLTCLSSLLINAQ